MKQLLSAFLTLVLLVGLFPANTLPAVFAAEESQDHDIVVGSMNYGLWENGLTPEGVPAAKVDSTAAAWKKMLQENEIDLICGQEWVPYLDEDKTVDANEKIFSQDYPYQYSSGTSTYNGKHVASKTALTDMQTFATGNGSGRTYAKGYTTVNGKTVCILNAHLSFEEDITVHRQAEIRELLAVMSQEEYVILTGDFNVFEASEFQLFADAGYRLANCGDFGQFNTWPNFDKISTADVNRCLDNIIVSPSIAIRDAYVDRRDLSDHAMVVAKLELLDAGEYTDTRTLCAHCGQQVQWLPWTLTNGGTADPIREDAHYYLTADISGVTDMFRIGVSGESMPDVVIDLRGHSISAASVRAFYLRPSSKLSIMDTIGGGKITSGYTSTGGAIYLESGCAFTLYGGDIYATDTTTAKKGGAIYAASGSTVTLKGGSIHGSYGSDGGVICCSGKNTVKIEGGTLYGSQATNGGAIYITSGTLEMTGGTIVGGQATNGGNIYATGSTVTVSCDTAKNTAATVTGGHATNLAGNIYINSGSTLNLTGGNIADGISDARGGNIYNAGANTYNITAGSLTGGKAGTDGANMFVNNSSVVLNISGGTIDGGMDIRLTPNINLSGVPVITGEKGGLVLSLGSTHAKIKPGVFSKGAQVCVSASGVFTDELTDAESYLEYIKPGSSALRISVTENKLTAGTVCPHCGEAVEWIAWEDAISSSHSRTAGGHFYLTENISGTGRYKIDTGTSGETVVIDLRGFNITSTNDRVFYVSSGKLAIVDSVGTGVLKGNRNGDGNIRLEAAQVDMYGGTVVTSRATVADTGYGSIICVGNANGVFNLYGGLLDGSAITTPTATSGTVYTKGTVNMYGGAVTGGYSNNGGNVYVTSTGKLNLEYGTIRDGKATGYGGNVYIVEGGSFTMSGGNISGGIGDTDGNEDYNGDNVYVDGTMTMRGGSIDAKLDKSRITTSSDKLGNGILCWAGATVTLDGDATVLNAEKTGNIYVGSTGGITVKKTFTGEASLAVVAYYHLSDPVLGGILTGTNDVGEGHFDGKLYLEGGYGYPRIYGLENGKLIVGGTASLMDANGKPTAWYEYAQDAADSYGTSAYMKLYADSAVTLADGSYTIDLNGRDAVVSGNGTVIGSDSANADFKTFGYLSVAQGASVTVGNDFAQTTDAVYYMLQDENGYSFHRLEMEITGVSLRTATGGIYYWAAWKCDDALAAQVKTFGIACRLQDAPTSADLTDGKTLYSELTTADFKNDGTEITGAIMNKIIVTEASRTDANGNPYTNLDTVAIPVNAAPYVVFQNNETVVADKHASYSIKDVILAIDGMITQKKAADAADADAAAYTAYMTSFCDLFKDYLLTQDVYTQWGVINFGPTPSAR